LLCVFFGRPAMAKALFCRLLFLAQSKVIIFLSHLKTFSSVGSDRRWARI
jgi:hypothetical protein